MSYIKCDNPYDMGTLEQLELQEELNSLHREVILLVNKHTKVGHERNVVSRAVFDLLSADDHSLEDLKEALWDMNPEEGAAFLIVKDEIKKAAEFLKGM